MGLEDLFQTRAKWMGRRFGNLVTGDKKLFLNISTSSKGHGRLLPPAVAPGFQYGSKTSMTTQGKPYLKMDFSTLSTGC